MGRAPEAPEQSSLRKRLREDVGRIRKRLRDDMGREKRGEGGELAVYLSPFGGGVGLGHDAGAGVQHGAVTNRLKLS